MNIRELKEQVLAAGGEMDAPGGGKYRIVGDHLWHYDASDIAKEQESKLTIQQKQNALDLDKSSRDALAGYYGNRKSADTMGQIDVSALDSLPSMQPKTEPPASSGLGIQTGGLGSGGLAAAGMRQEERKEPVAAPEYPSSPVEIPPQPAAEMARDKSAMDRYQRMQNELGQYRGNNNAIDLALDDARQMALAEQSAKRGPSGMGGGWQQRSIDWDEISAMPEGDEKERAKVSYLYKWAPSSGYGASPESIKQSGLRAGVTAGAGKTAQIEAETEAGGGVNPIVTDRTNALRREFGDLPEIKSIKTLYSNWSKANKASEDYKAGKIKPYEVDQSLGYFASKALDPNSVVMPGEFDRFAKGLGLQGVQAMAEQLISGGLRLTDDQRAAMLGIVNRAMESGKDAARPQYDYYAELAAKNGADRKSVVGGLDYIFANKKSDGDWTIINGVKIRKKR